MTTWHLWRALHFPPICHPLFDRISAVHSAVDPRLLWGALSCLIVGVLILFPGMFIPLLLLAPLLYTLLNATLNGMNWAFNVSGLIALMRSQNAYEVLCLIPDGALTVNWVIYVGRLYHDEAFTKSRSDMFASLQLMALIGFGILLGMLMMPTAELIEGFSLLAALMIVVYLDYMQSVMTSGLVALLIGNLTRNVADARMWAVAAFGLIQMALYLTLIVLVLVIVPAVHTRFINVHWLPLLLTPLLIVLAFCALRELVLAALWARLSALLNADHGLIHRLDRLARI